MAKFEDRYRRRKRGGWIVEASLVSTCRVGSRGEKRQRREEEGGLSPTRELLMVVLVMIVVVVAMDSG